MKASDRHQLKHDEFVDSVLSVWTRVKAWTLPRKHWVGALAVLVFIGVCAYIGVQVFQQSRTQDAWEALERERAKETGGQGQADYSGLAEKYAGTGTEPWILYYWGMQCVEKAAETEALDRSVEWKKTAIQTLERLRSSHPEHPLNPRGRLVVARLYSDLGEWRKAAEQFEPLSRPDFHSLDLLFRQEAQFGLAYAFEAQEKFQEAIANYRELASSETSRWADEARYRLERLHAFDK